MPKAKPVPAGYHALTPYLSIKGASDAIAFYKKAFGAQEMSRMGMPDGRVGHAELRIGDSHLMLADEFAEMPDPITKSPPSLGGVASSVLIYLDDVDTAFKRAVDAGAKIRKPLADQFYGDRSGVLEDPFGHIWTLSTHVEDVSPAEMKKRMDAIMSEGEG